MADADPKERLRGLLDRLPLGHEACTLYQRGLERMTDEEARACADELEAGLAAVPEALASARRLLASRGLRKDDKPRSE